MLLTSDRELMYCQLNFLVCSYLVFIIILLDRIRRGGSFYSAVSEQEMCLPGGDSAKLLVIGSRLAPRISFGVSCNPFNSRWRNLHYMNQLLCSGAAVPFSSPGYSRVQMLREVGQGIVSHWPGRGIIKKIKQNKLIAYNTTVCKTAINRPVLECVSL